MMALTGFEGMVLVFGIISLVLFAFGVTFTILAMVNRWKREFWLSFVLACYNYFVVIVFQNVGTYLKNGENQHLYSEWMIHLPSEGLIFIFVICVVGFIALYLFASKRPKERISKISIIQGLNDAPMGIYYCTDSGLILLSNRMMDDLNHKITGRETRNGIEFWQKLTAGTVAEGCTVIETGDTPVILCDDHYYQFSKKEFFDEGTEYKEVLAIDITDEHLKNIELHETMEKLQSVNQRLKRLGNEITETSIQNEILQAKISIHDELGYSLLVARRYLMDVNDNKEEVKRLLKRNIFLLRQEYSEQNLDYYGPVFKAAKDVGVEIVVDGNLPETSAMAKICATALNECLTNILRHAHGDELYVKSEWEQDKDLYLLKIWNNGLPPHEKIKERGGLKSLREMVERSGGEMVIESKPIFLLKISLLS